MPVDTMRDVMLKQTPIQEEVLEAVHTEEVGQTCV